MGKIKENTVSLCMIVKDEEKDLPRCLESVKDVVDEMIIVDTGSTDKTIDIAESFGAKIYNFKWINDFSAARNESIKFARCDWILFMDADDEFCKEDKKNLLDLLNNEASEVYYFETHSYVGNYAGSNISINLNLRLLKNNRGYYFSHAIHEQLRNDKIEAEAKAGIPITVAPIKIYHYGYLYQTVERKNKRKRNMDIIKKQIETEPSDPFHYFNLGSEYFALDDFQNAIANYNIVYNTFNPTTGYAPKMLLRMVLCHYYLGNYDKALELIGSGLHYYPKYTDLEFLNGMIYEVQEKFTLAIESYNKAILMGAAPPELKFIEGVEGFRSLEALANIYINFEDYNMAHNFALKCLQKKPDYLAPLYTIIKIYKKQNMPLEQIKTLLKSFFSDSSNQFLILFDLFYVEEYYETALEYLDKYLKADYGKYDNIMYLKAKCLIRISKYEECLRCTEGVKLSNIYYFEISMIKVLCLILNNNLDIANIILNEFETHKSELQLSNQKKLAVYRNLFNVSSAKELEILSEDEKDIEYSYAIFSILDILLTNKEYTLFEKSLQLLNTISDKTVLLKLGELYYKHKLNINAKKTILQSIKGYEIFDKKSLIILCKLI